MARARLHLQNKQLKLAFNDVDRVMQIDSTQAPQWLLMGDVLFAAIKVPQAIETFKKALLLAPNSTDAMLKLAELELFMKAYPQAIAYTNQALQQDQSLAKAYFIKGYVYLETGDTGKAISSLTTATEQDPQQAEAYNLLGNIYTARNNPLALIYYRNALKIEPRNTDVLYNIGYYHQQHQQLNDAIGTYTQLLQIDPHFKEAHFNLGYIHMAELKMYAEAIKYYTQAIQSDQAYHTAYLNRGACYEALGNTTAARADYTKALDIVPTYQMAKDALRRLKP
jgi:tetratricopeptide (TPR) repeat protein